MFSSLFHDFESFSFTFYSVIRYQRVNVLCSAIALNLQKCWLWKSSFCPSICHWEDTRLASSGSFWHCSRSWSSHPIWICKESRAECDIFCELCELLFSIILDDEDSISRFLSTTVSSIDSTTDDDVNDDDEPIAEHERKDEINDSKKTAKIDSTKWDFPSSTSQNVYFYIFISATEAVLGVNICLIFFGWLLAITSLLLIYGTFKRQSKLLIPYIFALFETVLLVILLEILPEFIDNLGVGWFLLLNFIIGKRQYWVVKPYQIYGSFIFYVE